MKSLLAILMVGVALVGCDNREAPVPYGKPSNPEGKPVDRAMVKDPVCGMMVDSAKAKDHTTDGVKYYFCSDACHDAFEKAPGNYAGKTGAPEGKAAEQAGVKDFVCGMMVEKKEAHTHTHGDVKYYFCSDACEDTFKKDPATYINKAR